MIQGIGTGQDLDLKVKSGHKGCKSVTLRCKAIRARILGVGVAVGSWLHLLVRPIRARASHETIESKGHVTHG